MNKQRLASLLQAIKMHDIDYDTRYRLVLEALSCASNIGLKAGIKIDPRDPAWPVVYINLPQGQVSWHLPEYGESWDGHTTDEKYKRIDQFWCSVMGSVTEDV